MRIMAIDYGDAHTGVAVSDPTGFLTGDVTTIHSRKAEVVLEELVKLVQTYQVDELVMGFPRNMDGTEGPRAELYRTFAGRVEEATGLKPVLGDERRTTVDAHRILVDAGTNGGPPWTPTVSCLRREKTPESEKRRWMRWRPP